MPACQSGRLHPAEETMNDLPLRPAADIGAVEDRFFTLPRWQRDHAIEQRASS
jgi:hypothetical protein